MDPILGAIVLVLLVRRLVVDTAYAVRGKTPPSYRIRMAKLQAQGKTPAKAAGPARYGSRDYLRDLWLDAVEDARDARVAKRAADKAKAAETAGGAVDQSEIDRGPVSEGQTPATTPPAVGNVAV